MGSAAYNLLVITAVCVMAIPSGQGRLIKDLNVFYITAAASIFAYVWLLYILMISSPNIVDLWEGSVKRPPPPPPHHHGSSQAPEPIGANRSQQAPNPIANINKHPVQKCIAFWILLRVVSRSRGLPDAFWTDLQRFEKHRKTN